MIENNLSVKYSQDYHFFKAKNIQKQKYQPIFKGKYQNNIR